MAMGMSTVRNSNTARICLTLLRIRVCSIHRLNLNLLQCTSMRTITTGIIPMHRRLQRVTMMMVIVAILNCRQVRKTTILMEHRATSF